jgi:hypothetical protein
MVNKTVFSPKTVFSFLYRTNLNANAANRRMKRIIFVFIRDIRSFVSFAMKIRVRFSTCTVANFSLKFEGGEILGEGDLSRVMGSGFGDQVRGPVWAVGVMDEIQVRHLSL